MAIPEVVQYNPCDRAVVPAGVPAKRREWLDEERQGWVLNTPHRAKRAAMVMMLAGLRRGEATARDQMGHSSVQVTQEIYTHLDAKYKAKKMEALDEYLDIGRISV